MKIKEWDILFASCPKSDNNTVLNFTCVTPFTFKRISTKNTENNYFILNGKTHQQIKRGDLDILSSNLVFNSVIVDNQLSLHYTRLKILDIYTTGSNLKSIISFIKNCIFLLKTTIKKWYTIIVNNKPYLNPMQTKGILLK